MVPVVKEYVGNENEKINTLRKNNYQKLIAIQKLDKQIWDAEFSSMNEKVYKKPLLVETGRSLYIYI